MNMQTIDPKRFRSVMGTFPTGVAVVATKWNGKPFRRDGELADIGVAGALACSFSAPTKSARQERQFGNADCSRSTFRLTPNVLLSFA